MHLRRWTCPLAAALLPFVTLPVTMPVASAPRLPQHQKMKTRLKSVLVAAALTALAASAGAQTSNSVAPHSAASKSAQKHPQKPNAKAAKQHVAAGEAVSLERTEAGQKSDELQENNHGRLTTAKTHHPPKHVTHAVAHAKPKAPAQLKTVSQQNHAAKLVTGQHTTRRPAPSKNKALPPNENPSDRETLHLKEHNARMF